MADATPDGVYSIHLGEMGEWSIRREFLVWLRIYMQGRCHVKTRGRKRTSLLCRRYNTWLVSIALLFLVVGSGRATALAEPSGEDINLEKAVLVSPQNLSTPELNAIEMLVDELEKRTLVRWEVLHKWPEEPVPVVAIGQRSRLKEISPALAEHVLSEPAADAAEGYSIRVIRGEGSNPAVFVIGNDARGVLFGAGRLLREMRMSRGSVILSGDVNISTAPKYPLRGHQLGYRPKVNTYDAWTIPFWEQYIRDLAVFGNNAIEMIPPRSDDAPDSPHFPRPQIDMMARISKLADDYGIDVWIWYPAMDRNYADPDTVEFALKEWGEVFKRLPRIDTIMVPGGDPGHTQPKYLMPLLEKQTRVLHKYHPNAQMWVSTQSFGTEWLNEFLEIVRTQEPAWLGGVVFGPQNRISLPALRAALPDRYPIRRYPDITHSIRCQYAVPDWDVAYVVTEDREVINPRPRDEARIFRLWDDSAVGFITYSEGVNDDVNKIVWSGLGWDPETDVVDILRDYSRYFIGEQYADDWAQGLLALERNWQGPLLTNKAVFTTLKQFQDMERAASPQVLLNWRFQQGLYRAYYDAYVARRLVYETALEQQAMDELRQAEQLGSLLALDRAEAILDRAVTERQAADLRARVFELAEALYQSIRMQLSVPRYKAISAGRGANLDLIDRPLNDRNWLKERFSELREASSDRQRLRGIDDILNWTDPGPGGYYDDLGNLTQQPHLVRGLGYKLDPEFRESSRVGFAYNRDHRMSWVRFAESRYDAPLKMHYTNLDPNARYKVRVVYGGDNFRTRIRLEADEGFEVHPFIRKERRLEPVEFDIPQEATRDGQLTLIWHQEPGRGGAGRGCQVSEVWLVKD